MIFDSILDFQGCLGDIQEPRHDLHRPQTRSLLRSASDLSVDKERWTLIESRRSLASHTAHHTTSYVFLLVSQESSYQKSRLNLRSPGMFRI